MIDVLRCVCGMIINEDDGMQVCMIFVLYGICDICIICCLSWCGYL